MATDDALRRFQEATKDDVATLLMEASRAINQATLAQLDPAGQSGVRLSHVPLIAALEPEGSRLVDLAHRVGVTRQAIAALTRDLAAAGVVEIAPDPDDKRASRVHLTPAGARFCDAAVEAVRAREATLAGELGAERLDALRQALAHLAGR